MTAPVEGKAAKDMAVLLYAEGRRLREAGFPAAAENLLSAGAWFLCIAIKGREAALDVLSQEARQ